VDFKTKFFVIVMVLHANKNSLCKEKIINRILSLRHPIQKYESKQSCSLLHICHKPFRLYSHSAIIYLKLPENPLFGIAKLKDAGTFHCN